MTPQLPAPTSRRLIAALLAVVSLMAGTAAFPGGADARPPQDPCHHPPVPETCV